VPLTATVGHTWAKEKADLSMNLETIFNLGRPHNSVECAVLYGWLREDAAATQAIGATTAATVSDIAGSTRIPASVTGNVGFKASYDIIPAHSALISRPVSGLWSASAHCARERAVDQCID